MSHYFFKKNILHFPTVSIEIMRWNYKNVLRFGIRRDDAALLQNTAREDFKISSALIGLELVIERTTFNQNEESVAIFVLRN